MAKQISLKNQIYQQIANKQVQQVMANQREQGIQQLQADFNAWQTRQNEIAQLQADFDVWKQQNAPQVRPQSRQTIPSIADVQSVAHEQTEMEKHISEVTKQAKEKRLRERAQKLQQLEQIEASQPHSKKERETLANIEDISKKLTNVVPETEALDTVTKTWKRGQRPEATDTSSQVAARVTNEKKPEIDTTNVPVNVDRWLSPDTKLTEAEKKKAKEYASAELQKVQYGPNKQPLLNTPEERQHYADMVNLINKTNGFTNFMSGAIEVPYNLADMVSDGARSVGNQLGGLGAAITDKLGVTKGATQRHNEQAEIANQFADQNEANMRQNFKNAQTQNPGAYTVGKIAGQTGMYMLTNPVFDGIAAGAGVESELAKFFINQGAQNVQDLVLDTAPTVRQLMEDGSTPEEVKREALNNILWNVAGNAVMGGLGAWAGNRAARKASDEAFRENVRAGADNLSRIANEIPGIEDADNVVRNATRQADEVVQNIDNIAKQQNDGIRVYRGFNRSDNPLEKNLAGEKSVYDALGKNDPNAPNMLPLNFYTESIDDAAQYANADKAFYESLGETARRDAVARATENGINFNELSEANRNALIKQYQDEAYRNLTGRNPNFSGSHVDEISINPKKVLDISDLDEKVFVDDLYNRLSELTGVDKNTIDNRLMLSNVADENGMVSQYQILRNTGQTAGDFTGTRFVDFMLDHGYDAIKHKESGVNHYVTLNNAADTLKIPQFLSDSTIENDIMPYANALAEQVQSIGASRRFEKAYEDLWDYIYARRNELEPKWRDLSKIESELRSSAPDGVDVDSFINRINEVINPYKERKVSDIASNVVSSKNATRGELLIQEVNRKGGKKGYYVAESVGDGASKNVEPGKVYKTKEEAEKAMDQYRTMAESISKPKSEIITSEPIEPGKYEIPDTPENAPKDVPPVDGMKERGTSKHIRNAGTPMKMEDVADEVAADFEKDPDMYKVLRNADTKAKAEQIYNTSDNPEAEFRSLLEKKDPAALPLGHQLAKDYSEAGNHDAAAQIYRDMGKALTESGQFSQAAIINMVKNDPMTALQYAQKEIDSLNDVGRKRFGDRWKDFELTQQELDAFKGIKAGDADAIKALYENIGNRLGKEYPTTLWDKIIEARRVAMLFNPRTNVRNLGANPPTLAMRWLSDRVEAVGQNIAHLINPDIKVTQSLTGSGLRGRKIASEVYNSNVVKSMLNNSGSKSDLPELKNSVMQHKQIFKGTALEKWIDRVTGGGIQKLNQKLFDINGVQSIPETVRNATYKLLDLGDRPFIKENFVERLGSYINATGIKNANDVPEEAIQMAWEEAMKATYKDNSWAVDMLRNIKKGVEKADNVVPGLGTTISQSAIPFVQAPGNIAARMVDYSPVGAGKGIAKIIKGARANDVKAVTKGIEEASKGLTGTGLIYLGMKLRESGLVTGTYSENKRQKAFEKQNGFKEFALHVGDKYFTYGWAQPAAQTIMVGSLLQDAIEKSDEYDSDMLNYFGIENSKAGKGIGVVKAGTRAAVNSWFNESPLSGLADFLKGNSYSDTDIAGNLWENGVQDFAGALVPSVVNATAKVVDTTQRNAYDPSNTFGTFVNSNIAKIPGLSKILPAKYDTWGREMKYAETKGAAAAARYAIPGEYSYDRSDKIDNEINRLFSEAKDEKGNLIQDSGVFPTVAPNAVGDKKLNNKEVSEYQKDMGTRSRTAVETFMASDAYKSMGDPEKIEAIKKIYGASNAITKRDKFDYPLADNSEYKKAVAVYDKAGGGEKGAKALAEFYSNRAFAEQSGLSASSKAFQDIENDLAEGNTEAAQQKVDAAQRLPELGLDMPGPAATYNKAVGVIPGITVDDFAKTYKAMDADHNQALKKVEVIDYMNSKNMGQSEGMRFWKAYAKTEGERPWKIPSLNDGTWK